MSYNNKIIDLFRNPKHAGNLEDANASGEVGNMKCGDVMKVMIKVKGNVIEKVRFETFGCVAAMASSEALCELVEGKTLEEAQSLTNQDIVDYLGDMPPVKIHCSILGANALKAAIKDYHEKHKE